MNRHYGVGGPQQFSGPQFVSHHPHQNVIRPGSPVSQRIPPQQTIESFLSQSHGKLSSSHGYIGSSNAYEATQQIQSRLSQHRGLHGYYPDNLADTVHIRNGGDYSKTIQDHPSYISEHIQHRPHSNLDRYQDAEGLDVIRIQATRVSNLLDRVEILDKEVQRQSDFIKEKDEDLNFWAKKYFALEHKRNQTSEEIETHYRPEETKFVLEFVQDKFNNDNTLNERIKNENLLQLKLNEIEDCKNEIDYWKAQCTQNEDQYNEIKRLNSTLNDLTEINKNLNKKLMIVQHQQKMY